jgi:hypothetical protein
MVMCGMMSSERYARYIVYWLQWIDFHIGNSQRKIQSDFYISRDVSTPPVVLETHAIGQFYKRLLYDCY